MKTEKASPVISGSYASAEAIAHIMVQKFVMGSPLYRQEQEWKRQGVKFSRQTMSHWILREAEDWLVPVYEELHWKLAQRDVLHADERYKQRQERAKPLLAHYWHGWKRKRRRRSPLLSKHCTICGGRGLWYGYCKTPQIWRFPDRNGQNACYRNVPWQNARDTKQEQK